MISKAKVLFRLSVLLLFFVSASAIYAQTGTIKGTIVDAKTKEPLIGASVLVEGTTNGAAADLDGNFVINNVSAGTHSLIASYVAYQPVTKTGIAVETNRETVVDFEMNSDDISLEAVEVVARANRESENILLLEQKKALLATQAVGARELSRKGIGNAEAAVSKISGISKQEGVKNVFVRGLGDRYNATTLNGFLVPSEDPEYKNIALDFFGTDIIQNVGVNKVFSGSSTGDAGGAIIDISSKELINDRAFGAEISGGLNRGTIGVDFLRQDGSNYLGFANNKKPNENKVDFANSLDPTVIKTPVNHTFGISGGKQFKVGADNNPLSFFIVGSHGTNYSYTGELIRNTTSDGTIYQDQQGDKYSQNINQLVLGNINFGINKAHNLAYNFMMVHANNQYVGQYSGKHTESHQDSNDYTGRAIRQQTNDNLLFTHQLISSWKLSNKMKLNAGASYNRIKGLEPDRRENYLSKQDDGTYILTGSNRQKRFFSELKENDINTKVNLQYKLNDEFDNTNSALEIGYNGRFVDDKFEAVEYNFDALSGTFPIDNLQLDDLYNQANYESGKYTMSVGELNTYNVKKNVHSAYAEATYQLTSPLTANVGLRVDNVDMTVNHRVQHVEPGRESIKKTYFLPSLNLKYDLNDKNAIRMGLSKTYTLPQSKEISPYQYVNIGFASQGNPNLKPSDNYNADLKWDYYLSPSELFTVTGFFKHIVNPIGRVDQGNSAGLLSYSNISAFATVAGIEVELRKNLINRVNTATSKVNRVSLGLNASYIYTDLEVDIVNTPRRKAQLEGAAPFIGNFDVSYSYSNRDKNLLASVVFNYFSNRVHTIGTRNYGNIIEEGVPTIDFVSSYKFNKNFTAKFKASNLLDPSLKLSRRMNSSGENIILNKYKKGINLSLGVSYDL